MAIGKAAGPCEITLARRPFKRRNPRLASTEERTKRGSNTGSLPDCSFDYNFILAVDEPGFLAPPAADHKIELVFNGFSVALLRLGSIIAVDGD